MFEPLQDGTGSDQFRSVWEVKCFGISGQEGDPLVQDISAAMAHLFAKVVQQQVFRAERTE